MNRILVFVVAAAVGITACNDATPPDPRCTGAFSGGVSAPFACEPAITYHAATDTTYVAFNLAPSSRSGETAGAIPGYITLKGRPAAGEYDIGHPRVISAVAGAHQKDVVFVAGKNVQTGQVFGPVRLVLRQLTAVPGAELAEDQAYTARGSFEAGLEYAVSARGPELGGARVVISF